MRHEAGGTGGQKDAGVGAGDTTAPKTASRGTLGSTVLVTAGASAPEDLVAGVCRALIERYGGTIEQRDVFEEDVEFALPSQLRKDMRARGIDPETRRIHVSKAEVTAEGYGVGLTVSGRRAGRSKD
jgi:hypothetical protein